MVFPEGVCARTPPHPFVAKAARQHPIQRTLFYSCREKRRAHPLEYDKDGKERTCCHPNRIQTPYMVCTCKVSNSQTSCRLPAIPAPQGSGQAESMSPTTWTVRRASNDQRSCEDPLGFKPPYDLHPVPHSSVSLALLGVLAAGVSHPTSEACNSHAH